MSPSTLTPPPSTEQVTAALARVNDPEIRRPITDLGMVKSVDIAPDGKVRVEVYLTVAGCPLRNSFQDQVQREVGSVPGVAAVSLDFDVMSPDEKAALSAKLRGGVTERTIFIIALIVCRYA